METEKRIGWESAEFNSTENLVMSCTCDGFVVSSEINMEGRKAYFEIGISLDWKVQKFQVRSSLGPAFGISYESDGNGNWQHDGIDLPEFEGCIDIDILPSPFTNTLPIRRLDFETRKSHEIKVLYMDLLKCEVYPVLQKYTRLSGTHYKFETVPNGFEAILSVDVDGFVIEYPGLFSRRKPSPDANG